MGGEWRGAERQQATLNAEAAQASYDQAVRNAALVQYDIRVQAQIEQGSTWRRWSVRWISAQPRRSTVLS